ncbi:MAG: hypothetical protein WBO43_02470 [Gemmatimonadota bacterium]|jgi:hypothetical protein
MSSVRPTIMLIVRAGIYLWDSDESLAAYLESDLRKTIPSAYELTEPPRVERFPIVDVLRT